MLLPVSDENEDYTYPYVNVAIILVCVGVHLWLMHMGPDYADAVYNDFGFVSAQYLAGYKTLSHAAKLLALLKAFFNPYSSAWVQAITATFLHASWPHLIGNMLFLWIFGDNVEHVMGRARYLLFFILTGVLSQFTQTLVGGVTDIPCIGASGAISAVMGAYLVYYPKVIVNVYLMVPMPRMPDSWPDNGDDVPHLKLKSRTYLLFFLLNQLLTGFMTWGTEYVEVAVWAHIGGYLFGFALAWLFRDPEFMYKEEADRLFGSTAENEPGMVKNQYNEYIFGTLPWRRGVGRLKRPTRAEMQAKHEPHRSKRKFGWVKKPQNDDLHRKKRHHRPELEMMRDTGYREAQRRKRLGGDWMKHNIQDGAWQMSQFGHLRTACRAFGDYEGTWFFCGGNALDLFRGRPIRLRQDVDIGVFRDEQDLLPKHFPGVKISYAVPGEGRVLPWQGAVIELPVHELYLELPGERLEVLLNEATATHWVYRRDARVTRDLSKAVLATENGIPYLAPEIVLLYKSKHMRDRDIVDFEAVIGDLGEEQKNWLKSALEICYLGAHPWSALAAK